MTVSTFVGGEGSRWIDGGVSMAPLNGPSDLVAGINDVVFIADTQKHRIRTVKR